MQLFKREWLFKFLGPNSSEHNMHETKSFLLYHL